MNYRSLFLSHLAQTSGAPLMLEVKSAKGSWLFSPDGKKYLDLISGISVSNLGHCHPDVVKAVQLQAETHMHTMVYGEYILSPQVLLAKKITETLPAKLDSVYLVNSGAEAVEGAMKLAKRYTGRSEIFSFENSYHGSTQGALSIMGNEFFKQAFRPLLPGHRILKFNDYSSIEFITNTTAAVFIELIQGEAGIRTAHKDWLLTLQKKCNDTGTLLVADEIQTGFGRTGSFWAFEQFGIVPDILLSAKGMGGGMPIGAFIANKNIMHVLTEDPVLGHITTFGGHPVSCAASLATIDVLLKGDLISDVQRKAALINEKLKHPKILDFRYFGLMMCAELGSFQKVQHVIQGAIEDGVITDWFLFCDTAIRIAPPLTITDEEIEFAIGVLLKHIAQC